MSNKRIPDYLKKTEYASPIDVDANDKATDPQALEEIVKKLVKTDQFDEALQQSIAEMVVRAIMDTIAGFEHAVKVEKVQQEMLMTPYGLAFHVARYLNTKDPHSTLTRAWNQESFRVLPDPEVVPQVARTARVNSSPPSVTGKRRAKVTPISGAYKRISTPSTEETDLTALPRSIETLEKNLSRVQQGLVRDDIESILSRYKVFYKESEEYTDSAHAVKVISAKVSCFARAWQAYYEKGRKSWEIRSVVLGRCLMVWEDETNIDLTEHHLKTIFGNKDLSRFNLQELQELA